MTRRGFVIALTATILAAGPAALVARADKKKGRSGHDHDDARRAREGGSILALPEVLGIVDPHIDGEIIETEFENEDGRPVYEFKYVDRKGSVLNLYVDATFNAI